MVLPYPLNEEIEKKTTIYINKLIYKYNINDFDENKNFLISVESYIYGIDHSKIIDKYEKKLPFITNEILINKNIDIYLLNCLKQAPKLINDIIVYRGISVPLKISEFNNTFEHITPLWCSFHSTYAKNFIYDTSQCYDTYIFDHYNINFSQKGMLLKIHVPIGTPCFERVMPYDLHPWEVTSEIILLPGLLKIINSDKYIINCNYIQY